VGKPFVQEVERLALTVRWALSMKVDQLALLLSRWADGTLIFVGSGGSYSAATICSRFHRSVHGQPSYACTPLGLNELLNSLNNCRVVLLSAEGRNNDILNSALLARASDIPCAAITLTDVNPLTRFADQECSLHAFSYNMDWGKDGYLATNTLLAMVMIVAKAYFKVTFDELAPLVTDIYLDQMRKKLEQRRDLNEISKRGVVLLHGADSELFAVDLESKLAESALARCEVVDYRQFAHGRHLQFSRNDVATPFVIAAFTAAEAPLANAMMALFPPSVRCLTFEVEGETEPARALTSLVGSILFTEAAGIAAEIDPGQPDVPDFGRKIYSQNSADYLPFFLNENLLDIAVKRKAKSRDLSHKASKALHKAARTYIKRIEKSTFKALICDFDGTLCHAHQRFDGVHPKIAKRLVELLNDGLQLGIASGRGDSVFTELRRIVPEPLWPQVWVGLYSGSVITRLDKSFKKPKINPDLKRAEHWLNTTALRYFIKASASRRGGQMSFRVQDHTIAARITSAFNHRASDTGHPEWRAFSSGHSIDLLDGSTSKMNVVAYVAAVLKINPETEILRIGDAGHAGGNDYELMQSSLSLSAEHVSESLTCCWNFSPAGVRQADSTHFYLQSMRCKAGKLNIKLLSK